MAMKNTEERILRCMFEPGVAISAVILVIVDVCVECSH
jgi:hypothetical protein